jgi:hypothetical protein
MFNRSLSDEAYENFFDLSENELYRKKFVGFIEDVDDPLLIGRCKVRIPFLHGKDYKTEDIPWAYPKYPVIFGKGGLAGSVSIPKKGAVVEVQFNEGSLIDPEYICILELEEGIKDILANDYLGTHVILSDKEEKLKIYYTKSSGLTIFFDSSFINIGQDNAILIEHKDTKSSIELRGSIITITSDSQINATAGTRIKTSSNEVWSDGKMTKLGHQPQYSAVLGEPLFMLLKTMASMIDKKLYPTPSVTSTIVEQMKKLVMSDTVKVSK